MKVAVSILVVSFLGLGAIMSGVIPDTPLVRILGIPLILSGLGVVRVLDDRQGGKQ